MRSGFILAENEKFAESKECKELVSQNGANAKKFNITNLINHLKTRHTTVYAKFCENKTREKSHRLAARREKAQSGGFTDLHQLMLQVNTERIKKPGPLLFTKD